jgi:hypothetical protein
MKVISIVIAAGVAVCLTACKPSPEPVNAYSFRTFGPGSQGAGGQIYNGPLGKNGEHCTEMGAGVSVQMQNSLLLAAGCPMVPVPKQ